MLVGKRRIRLGTLGLVILTAILLSFTTSIQAQFLPALPPYNLLWPIWTPVVAPPGALPVIDDPELWTALPPYNVLWPLWSQDLSPVSDGVPTPLISDLTRDTVLPVQPAIVWDPDGLALIIYNKPESLGGGLTFFNEAYGFNPWPPSYLLDETGAPAPIDLPSDWPLYVPSNLPQLAETVYLSNMGYYVQYGPYDGNEDAIADIQQENVVSLPIFIPEQVSVVTLVTPEGTELTAEDVENPAPDDIPEGVDFFYGFFAIDINNIDGAGATSCNISLPSDGENPTSYFIYGPTPDEQDSHWYEFRYDSETQTGATINENTVTLHFIDGLRGDSDLTINGTIVDPGGPVLCTENIWYKDADEDGYGDLNKSKTQCTQPKGYILNSDDCEDNCPDTFNLDQLDTDEDGIGDACDDCPNTETSAIVNQSGCSIDQLCPCDNEWKNHCGYVSCVAHIAESFLEEGLITEEAKAAIVSDAARSDCGHKPKKGANKKYRKMKNRMVKMPRNKGREK